MPNGIDLPACANSWSEQEIGLYNKLDFFHTKESIDHIKNFLTITKLLDPWNWTPKQGTTAKSVAKEPSPVLRQDFLPNTIQQMPKKDVIELAERTEQAQIYHHDVESMLLTFQPDFQDFLDNADMVNKDISEKITLLPEQFYETAIFHGSPMIYICGYGLVQAPYWASPNIALSKNQAFIADAIQLCTQPLSLQNLNLVCQVAANDLGVVPYQGGILADGTNGSFLNQKFCVVMDNEVWMNYNFDPFALDNRQLNTDLVTAGFKGSPFDMVIAKTQRFARRYNSAGTVIAPQTQEMGANAYDKGATIVKPEYAAAGFGIAYLFGTGGYKAIKPGPPPAPFSSGAMDISSFNRMDWNGKVHWTRNFNIKCLDQDGNIVETTNKYGRYCQAISSISMGIFPKNRRNVLPILYARSRVGRGI